MSVRDGRRPPFAWVALDALAVIRRDLPATRQAGARNALLALAEAASQRHDGAHADGDPLSEIAPLACLSKRRLRDHLADLKKVGLVRIEERRDDAGRDLSTLYVLLDSPGGAKSSYRGDGTPDTEADGSSYPTHAHDQEEKNKKKSPQPPQAGEDRLPRQPSGNRERDRKQYKREVLAWAARRGVRPADPFGGDTILRIVRNACRGDESADELRALAVSPTWKSRHVVVASSRSGPPTQQLTTDQIRLRAAS